MTLTLTRPGARTASARARRRRTALTWIATHALAVAAALMFLGPLAFIALTAVMTDQQALTSELWPRRWEWGNFADIFQRAPLLTWIVNSLMYAGLATVFMLLSSVPVAYALARLRFRGRGPAFLLVVTTMMLPPQVVAVPVYLVWARFDLTGTLWPLILPMLLGDAFSIFLLRQFLVTIPREYSDAARVDGCGELRTLLRVILPMARPAIAAVALFQFFYCWNDYYGPLLYAGTDPSHWTLSLGLASFKTVHRVQWNLTMAATLLAMAPVIVVFFFAQKAFIEGVKLTGVK
ncbi:carbohydrate ABC transporter permease [Sphaerisporangium sp. TRM90804]|uniref:carbohydrate ABC transporter permease n=1 Tax=Sphaerisporangium sp. TRM90804 TaxID=3031113 RepID=UPI002447B82A|nr:carbohydrate ABC transporter permease [Sphaerisporangium sp. TRM90804]MDH2430529.1 carbohydrate ABC transporter permease [Sphaerisporangium sp. TRM90804]